MAYQVSHGRVAFSPDSRILASGGGGTIAIWDVVSGDRLRTLSGHTRELKGVAFSPDGRRFASATSMETKLWDAITWTELCTLTGDFNEVSNVAFSPDSTLAARGSGDKTVRLWDANTGELLRSFIGHNSGVTCVAFTPDGRTLVSGSSDGTVLLWDLGSDPTSNSTVSIVPSVVTSTMPGEQLTVAVKIAARERVAGCRVTVMFDHAALRYVKAAAGDYVTEGALFEQPKMRGYGVWLEASKLDCDGESDGTLAVLTFEVRAVKTSTLHLSRVDLVDSDGERLFPRLEDAQVVEPRK